MALSADETMRRSQTSNEDGPRAMKVNWIFFGFYFCILSCLHIVHVFLSAPLIDSTAYLCAAYALLQCTLETGLLILCAAWIRHGFPSWTFPYALLVFLLFLCHLIDFSLLRLVSMSIWYALHFVFQETYSNFIELLIASDIPLLTWALAGLGTLLLLAVGLFLYRWTDRKKRVFPLRAFFLVLGTSGVLLLCVDYQLNSGSTAFCFERIKKALPWKESVFASGHPTLVLDAPFPSMRSEEELLSHLDSRTFSLLRRPDIYLFVTESLRSDFITKENAPNLYRFKEENLSFPTTFSNANATHLSWYSLFHSRFAFDWKKESLETHKKGSLPLRLLKKMGYKIHVNTSARLKYYQMNHILFGEDCQLADTLFATDELYPETYLNDEAVIDHVIHQMQEPASGRLFIIFLNSTHFDYSWPKKVSPFSPYQEKMNYMKVLLSKRCPQPLINRYRNALYFVDFLFGKFLHSLQTAPGGQEAIVVFTGDHGEEFYEQGNLFHTSELTYQQITPPLFYRFGQGSPMKSKVQCDTTCHMDIFPSLFHYLIGEDFLQDVLLGQSIFKKERWPYTLIARFNAGRAPYEYCIQGALNKLIFKCANTLDPLTSKELSIVSTKTLHDDNISVDADSLQEEFGPALRRLFPSSTP